MKVLTNVNASSFGEAAVAAQAASQQGQAVAFSGGIAGDRMRYFSDSLGSYLMDKIGIIKIKTILSL